VLWYKAWLETRARFLVSLLGMVALCSLMVYNGNKYTWPYTSVDYYYGVLQSGHAMLCVMWVLAVTLLLMGGLLRERAAGTAPFSLVLPVSRRRLIAIRVAMGALQAMALVIVPWCAMYVLAALTGKAHSAWQALFHVALLAGGGTIFFGAALLISSLVEGEYTAPAVSLGVALAAAVLLSDPSVRAYSPWNFILGVQYLDRSSKLLVGPLPWMRIAVSILLGAVFTGLSAKAIQARDF